ncbi:unnamed protein product [Microthlaspi erraticum]|uniref:F-box domain-containing protein n=1 Tax=Microthlaspi erraticum TaxID=1685480 RepID=A0A6D2IQP9_9BRAS|nr:unnamed protein product [Microthlaspi erraticum]
MTKTSMSNLPNELVEEILSRVPLKPVRLTCRNWNGLCKSQSFRMLHIGRLSAAMKEGETQMIAMIGDSRFLVWNPYLGQTRWIKPRISHSSFSYALGYEDKKKGKSCRSVKLLRYKDCYDYNEPQNDFFWYEIYDFDSDLWTTLDVVTPTCFKTSWGHVSIKGNTYWCAEERNSHAEGIICFDFTRERYGPLLPLPFSADPGDYVSLSCVREEKLAVLLQHNESNPYELDIWITTKIEAQKVSWSKFLRMDMGPDYDMFVPLIQIHGSFFIDEEKKVAMGVNEENPLKFVIIGEAKYVRELDLLEDPNPVDPKQKPRLCSYVPSLQQIREPAGGEGKRSRRESNLEKRRYDENRSRLAAFRERARIREKNRMIRLRSMLGNNA